MTVNGVNGGVPASRATQSQPRIPREYQKASDQFQARFFAYLDGMFRNGEISKTEYDRLKGGTLYLNRDNNGEVVGVMVLGKDGKQYTSRDYTYKGANYYMTPLQRLIDSEKIKIIDELAQAEKGLERERSLKKRGYTEADHRFLPVVQRHIDSLPQVAKEVLERGRVYVKTTTDDAGKPVIEDIVVFDPQTGSTYGSVMAGEGRYVAELRNAVEELQPKLTARYVAEKEYRQVETKKRQIAGLVQTYLETVGRVEIDNIEVSLVPNDSGWQVADIKISFNRKIYSLRRLQEKNIAYYNDLNFVRTNPEVRGLVRRPEQLTSTEKNVLAACEMAAGLWEEN